MEAITLPSNADHEFSPPSSVSFLTYSFIHWLCFNSVLRWLHSSWLLCRQWWHSISSSCAQQHRPLPPPKFSAEVPSLHWSHQARSILNCIGRLVSKVMIKQTVSRMQVLAFSWDFFRSRYEFRTLLSLFAREDCEILNFGLSTDLLHPSRSLLVQISLYNWLVVRSFTL